MGVRLILATVPKHTNPPTFFNILHSFPTLTQFTLYNNVGTAGVFRLFISYLLGTTLKLSTSRGHRMEYIQIVRCEKKTCFKKFDATWKVDRPPKTMFLYYIYSGLPGGHWVINNHIHSVTKGPPAGRYLLSKPVEKKKTLLRNTTHIKGIMYKWITAEIKL